MVAELCDVDGWTYFSVPSDAVLPDQPIQITIDGPLTLTADESDQIAAASPYVRRRMEMFGNADALQAVGLVPSAIQERFLSLNRDVQQYIYTHYDAGTQASFLSLHADPSTPAEGKTAIESVWAWVKIVMSYYYAIKAQVLAGDIVSWDFTQFDATDPNIQLSNFMTTP